VFRINRRTKITGNRNTIQPTLFKDLEAPSLSYGSVVLNKEKLERIVVILNNA